MKKAIFALSAFSLLSAVFFTSCTKETQTPVSNTNTSGTTTSGSNTVATILNLGTKYAATGQGNVALRPWQQYAAADAIGALDGAGTGGAVAGPWGALCGGITYGVFASCALDMFSMVAPDPGTPPVDGSDPTIPGTNVGVNKPGNHHNQSLTYVLSNPTRFGQAGNPDLNAIKTYAISDVSSRYGFDAAVLTNIVNSCKPYGAIVEYTEDPADYFATLGENNFRSVTESFFNTAFSITSNASLLSYYNSYVNVIKSSNDFNDVQKAEIMTYCSVTTATILYHNH